MNYRRDKNSSSGRKLAIALFFLAVLYIFSLPGVTTNIGGMLRDAAAPLWRAEQRAGAALSPIPSTVRSKMELAAENEELRRTIREMEEKLLDRNLVREENTFLRELLGRPDHTVPMIAGVLTTPGRAPYDTLIIDVGEREGVPRGARVFVGESLIGEVGDVSYRTSRVRLYSSPGEETPVLLIASSSPIHASATGRGAGNFELRLPRGTGVAKGDLALVPGIDGFLLGVVGHIDSKSNDPFEMVLLRGPVSLSTLRTVEVLIKE